MRFLLPISIACFLISSLTVGETASAQAPDIRNIRPHVMLLVDTSGSMERKPDCICSTPACLECLPVCSAGTYEQNRWAVVAQALAGEFTPFECNSDTRIGGIYTGQYDEALPLLNEIISSAEERGAQLVLARHLQLRAGILEAWYRHSEAQTDRNRAQEMLRRSGAAG